MTRAICLIFALGLLAAGGYYTFGQPSNEPPLPLVKTPKAVAAPTMSLPGALPTNTPRTTLGQSAVGAMNTPVKRTAPVVKRATPLSIEIVGPPDAIRGDQLVFNALVAGDVASLVWSVFRINDDGSLTKLHGLIELPSDRVAFSNRTLGLYMLTCTIVGRDFTPLTAEHQFQILDGNSPDPQPSNDPPMPTTDDHASDHPEVDPNAPPPPPQPQQPPQQTVGLVDVVAQLVNTIRSPNPLAEAKIVGGSFRQVANLASTNRLPAGTNLIAAVYQQAVIDLGQSAPAWQPFFQALEAGVKNPDANFLSQVASILAGMQ